MRYMLFAGNNFYPNGGFEDYRGIFTRIDHAMESAMLQDDGEGIKNWAHIVDRTNLKTVLNGYDNDENGKWEWKTPK